MPTYLLVKLSTFLFQYERFNVIHCSGDHRLPLSHQCTQWKRVTNELVQCDICEHLVKAPDNKTPDEAVRIIYLFFCIKLTHSIVRRAQTILL